MNADAYRAPPSRHETIQTGPPYYSNRQRLVLLTFRSVEEAEAWDAAGQPIHLEPT